MKAVADTSSLIHPAKVPAFWEMMVKTFDQLVIPQAVYEEVMRGKQSGSEDVPIIARAIEEGWIKVVKVKVRSDTS